MRPVANIRKYVIRASVVLCAGLAGLAALTSEGLTVVDGWLFDTALAVHSATGAARADRSQSDVAIVVVDSTTLEHPEMARWPRAFYGIYWAQLITTLIDAGARVVAFDMLLAYSRNAFQRDADRDFVAALARNKDRLVLGRSVRTNPAAPFIAALRNDPAALGLLEVRPDDDGVYRWVPAGFEVQEHWYASLMGAVLARLGHDRWRTPVLLAPDLHPESLPTFPLIDVLQLGRSAPETLRNAFAGKVVFVGGALPEEDQKITSARFLPRSNGDTQRAWRPGFASTAVPGVFLHAVAVDTVLRGRVTELIAPLWRAAIGAAAGAIGATIGLTLVPWLAVAAGLVALAGLWLGEIVLLDWQIWFPAGVPMIAVAAALALAYLIRYLLEDRRRRRVQQAFGRYLSPVLVARLADSGTPLTLGGANHDLTVMFADLSGFTALSRRIPASQLVALTNRYIGIVAREVDRANGYVDKFIGDAVMAIWGAPLPNADHAMDAAAAALRITEQVAVTQERDKRAGEHAFSIKVAIHSGDAIVGNVGYEKRFNYTAIGAMVNVAARLEALPGLYRCNVVAGAPTADAIRDHFLLRELDHVRVKGIDAPLTIFEIIADNETATAAQRHTVAAYENALNIYRTGDFARAASAWRALAEIDGPSQVMTRRAAERAANPPPSDWDGSYNLATGA